MDIVEKFKEKLIERAAEGVAVSLTALVVWAAYQVAPAILPAVEQLVDKKVLLALLVSSLVLNIIFAVAMWVVSRKPSMRLKYGIYWDHNKNPHCPSCKNPIAGYSDYMTAGTGYYCKPCGEVFPLQDAAGNNVLPAKAIAEL